MNNLIVIAHSNKSSFCYNGIFKTIHGVLMENKEPVRVIDLYEDGYVQTGEKTEEYKKTIEWSERIYFISPVWWFRCATLMENFFDVVFTPGFAYKFVPVIATYGYPKPLLKSKKVRTYLTHGAPALPVYTIYLNSVKLRLVMGVYSFVFGWFRTKTRQFWSVPFVTDEVRRKYLETVRNDIMSDIKST